MWEVAEIENIEMFHYDGVPVNGEKKVVTEAEDIETLYGKFHLLEVQESELPSYSSAVFPMTDMEEVDEHDLSADGSLGIAEQIVEEEILLVPTGVYINSEEISITDNGGCV